MSKRLSGATTGEATPRYASTMALVSTSGPMSGRAFAHLVEVPVPPDLAKVVRHVEQPVPLHELAQGPVDDRPHCRLRRQRHRLAHERVVEDDEIGRASCRERVEISVGAGGVKKKVNRG